MRSFDLSTDYQAAAAGAARFYGERMTEGLAAYDPSALFTFGLPWSNVEVMLTRLVCATYLRENGMTQGDRLAMASSVEMRLPLVDYRLVETVVGLRKTYGDAGLPPKTWLREAVRDALPADVFDRPKRGFEPPTREWHDALFAAYGDSLRGGVLVTSGILSREGAEDLARGAYPDGLTSPLSFKALVLEQWCRQMATLL
jgi:asparagine synthase (glutamine-hydrolysing)